MKLEEAIRQCEKFIRAFKKDDTKSVIGFDVQAIETVLQGLENSIPKKKIEDKMKQIDYRTANGEELYYQKAILQELLEE